MNIAQQIFLVFFAIFWGTVANAWPGRKPFQWPLLKHGPVFRRLILSMILLNIVPVLYFAWILSVLGARHHGVIIALLPAFSVFGFYRIWLGLTQCVAGWFYYSETEIPAEIKGIEPPAESWPRSAWALNVLIGAIYVAIGTTPILIAT
jgi:hypothetical protein